MKKTIALALCLILALSVLAGCSAQSDPNTIKVGASSTPHAEILESIKDEVAAAGYTLEVVVYDDYILPNKALTDGTLDANYFQHGAYLASYNEQNGTDLVSAASVHYEPFGIYGQGITNLADLADGATILIPADDSNETRALFLLQQEGLITLAPDADPADSITTLDIVDNGGYNIQAVQADTVPSQFKVAEEGSIAIINGNYALQAGLKIADALAIEDASGDAGKTYANIIAVRNGDENSEKTQVLVKALLTDAVDSYIDSTYNDAVVGVFQ